MSSSRTAVHGLRPMLAMTLALCVPLGAAAATDDAHAAWRPVHRICAECHNSTDWAAGISFDALSIDNPGNDAKVWEGALRRLRTGSMPPAGATRPAQKDVSSLVALLEARLDAAHLQSLRAEGGDAAGSPLGDLEFASRLSSFLWASVPDDELLRVAKGGGLNQPAQLTAQVRRMLADPRAVALTSGFGFRWLDVDRMDEFEPDASLFSNVDAVPDVQPLLKREMELFLDSVLRSDQPVTALLTADYTFVNDVLAGLYGIGSVNGGQFRRVHLVDTRRHGLLGKGAVLMATAFADRSSPTYRGSWILSRILGVPPYEGPPGIEGMPANSSGKPVSMRERLAQHTANPSCFSCHGLMDPLGFALESFDTIGQIRDQDPNTGQAVDTAGILPDGTKLTGPNDLRRMLAARPEQFAQTVTEQLMSYALDRPLDWHDMPVVRQIVRNAAKDNYRFASIVSQVVASEAFRQREPDPSRPIREASRIRRTLFE